MTLPDQRYTLDEAAETLGLGVEEIRTYVEEGLAVEDADGGGFSRAQMRRLWSAATLHGDLGINLAGVAAILQLREQYEQIRRDLALLVEIVERELGPDVWDRLWPEDRPKPAGNVSVEGVEDLPPPDRAGRDAQISPPPPEAEDAP